MVRWDGSVSYGESHSCGGELAQTKRRLWVCVCVCVCVCVWPVLQATYQKHFSFMCCMSVCRNVCVCVCKSVWVCVCKSVCVCVQKCTCVCACSVCQAVLPHCHLSRQSFSLEMTLYHPFPSAFWPHMFSHTHTHTHTLLLSEALNSTGKSVRPHKAPPDNVCNAHLDSITNDLRQDSGVYCLSLRQSRARLRRTTPTPPTPTSIHIVSVQFEAIHWPPLWDSQAYLSRVLDNVSCVIRRTCMRDELNVSPSECV